MKTALIIGGAALMVPYAWDSGALAAYSSSNGATSLPTFSGSMAIVSWESTLVWIGFVLFWIGVILSLA